MHHMAVMEGNVGSKYSVVSGAQGGSGDQLKSIIYIYTAILFPIM